ncbi:MAG: SPFH domain-containing protein [Lachnospiraceae bacterium]|nr:SPFH domain-containing protein [Lachnospiraceae bacterium]
MGIFSNQLLNVIEWNESRDDILFWKWHNDEIKKGSKLIIRPGQDAIFLNGGRIEGIFEDEGSYDIETQIIPFLSTLKGFKFGFNSGMRAEVLFINTKEHLVKWGTKNAINIPAQGLPGGMPIRAFGVLSVKIADYQVVIDKLAGVKNQYTVEDVKERIVSELDQLLMSWIAKEGHDMFNLQADARSIAKGIQEELDMDLLKIGISCTDFNIESFSYPEEVAKMQEKAAAQSMVGDVNKYTQMAMADSMGQGNNAGGNMAANMMNMQMGMMMGQQMMNQMNNANAGAQTGAPAGNGAIPKFCPNCGTPTNGNKFCGNCGTQLG